MRAVKHTIAIMILATLTLSGCGDSSGRYQISSKGESETYVLDTKDGTLWVALPGSITTSQWQAINMRFVKVAKIPKEGDTE